MTNLELKAVSGNLARLRTTLRTLGARHEPGPRYQSDWSFAVPSGR